MERVFTDVNDGVYQCGFAGSQEAYDAAYDRLWATMDWLEDRLSAPSLPHGRPDHRGRRAPLHHARPVRRGLPRALQVQPQQADRDAALWGYARDLYQTPGFGETIDFDQIKRHYYVVHEDINPNGIVPQGPDPAGWSTPHGRERS